MIESTRERLARLNKILERADANEKPFHQNFFPRSRKMNMMGVPYDIYEAWEAAPEALSIANELQAQLDALSSPQGGEVDNPEFDATDAAHPAWWRAHDYTAKVFCLLVNEILDGKPESGGIANEPWEGLKKRLYALRSTQPAQGGVFYVMGMWHEKPTKWQSFKAFLQYWWRKPSENTKKGKL